MKRLLLFSLLLLTFSPVQAERVPKTTVVGSVYMVEPAFEPVLQETIARLRALISEQRAQGKLIGFVSIPLSTRGGGYRDINTEVSEQIKNKLEKRFGADHFWALAPGLVESSLPRVNGMSAGGGEYMYMWTEVLAGPQGLGEQFDLIYFSGPSDFANYFGLNGSDDLGKLQSYLEATEKKDEQFAQAFSTPEQRKAFLHYYSMKASVNFSDGSHDEWNIFRRINERRRRELGIVEQLPIYFDGRQMPSAVLERSVSNGYEVSDE